MNYSGLYDLEIEKGILGLMITYPDSKNTSNIIKKLSESIFFDIKNGELFRIISKMIQENKAVDLLSVTHELRSKASIVLSAGYLFECVNSIISQTTNYHVLILTEFKIRRDLVKLAMIIDKNSRDLKKGYIEFDRDIHGTNRVSKLYYKRISQLLIDIYMMMLCVWVVIAFSVTIYILRGYADDE